MNSSGTDNLPKLPPGFDIESEFPIVKAWTFLNHAAVAPISARAARVLNLYAQQAADDAYLTGKWYQQAEKVRANAARLINASSQEIAFIKNTSEGLAFVANGWRWEKGDEIITANV